MYHCCDLGYMFLLIVSGFSWYRVLMTQLSELKVLIEAYIRTRGPNDNAVCQ